MNTDLLKAITDLARAIAWPFVAFVGLWWFKPEIRGLIGRFRRWAAVEFDPPAAQGGVIPPTAAGALTANLPPLPPSAAALLPEMRATPLLTQAANDAQRVDVLMHSVALLFFVANCERIDGMIWASQIALLEHLNALGVGDSPANLKARFYDPASARFPPMFANHPFERYLGFLQESKLIEVAGDVVRITQFGRDYLAWRVQAQKYPRLAG